VQRELDQLFVDVQHALAGEYSLERELGRGGMGVVYLARDVQLDRLVAIKVLPREASNVEETRERFLREARTAAGLSHPNIVPIYRVGEAAGLPYFVMAYVDGETLGERLRRRGPVMAAAMTGILRDVAQALGYAHGRGVIHRDVKPDNILLDRESGRALVSDFGIASRVDDSASHSTLVGTAQYMSPEQLQRRPLDGRSDLYALGLVAFLALSGKLPFDAGVTTSIMVQRPNVPPLSLAAAAPGLPATLVRAVDLCLMEDSTRRWMNAEALVNALEPDRAQRPAIPAALRAWARPTRLLDMLPVWAVGQTAIGVVGGHSAILLYIGVSPLQIAALAALPLLPIGVVRLRRTYEALAAGHTLADLRFALRWRNSAMMSDDESDQPRGDRKSHRFLQTLTLTALGVTALATASVYLFGYSTSTGQPRTIFTLPSVWITALAVLGRSALATGVVGTAALTTLGTRVLPPNLERRTFGRLRDRLWNSRVGEWLVARLTPRHRALPSSDFRPTEIALAASAEDLFAELPAPYRASLASLPSVVMRLTGRASALREKVDQLTKLMNDGGATAHHELAGRVEQSRSELSETVTALERVRLDLLRLHGGLADLRPITSTLDAARQLEADINRLRSAQHETASSALGPIDMRTPTPA
jgi:eukaryotic-like serine/threonine-protein kinase